MTEKFKKIDRQYVLSDSSVNVYGFRLLTNGYQLDAFRKNPIGYYMHRREDGIALKWDDLQVVDDQVVGTPVINLSHNRGEQTCNEAENGFLNAASVGHIVVLEYSTDPELMLPGQTGPTITKWYNKECSLVDIPGNCNALTALYDAQENEIKLMDLGVAMPKVGGPETPNLDALRAVLLLANDATEPALLTAVKGLAEKAAVLELENGTVRTELKALQQQLDELNDTRTRHEVTALLDRAIEDRKITVGLRQRLAADYAGNPGGLKELIAAMPAYRSIAENLSAKQNNTEAQWSWDDYEQNDPTGKKLKELRACNPVRYKELFDKKFGG